MAILIKKQYEATEAYDYSISKSEFCQLVKIIDKERKGNHFFVINFYAPPD